MGRYLLPLWEDVPRGQFKVTNVDRDYRKRRSVATCNDISDHVNGNDGIISIKNRWNGDSVLCLTVFVLKIHGLRNIYTHS